MLIKYEASHRDQCIALFLKTFHEKPFEFTFLTPQNTERYFCDLEQTPKFLGFVYIVKNTVLGFCLGIIVDYFNNISYDIKEIAVRYEIQGKGLGRQLLNEVEARLKRDYAVEAVTLATQSTIPAYEFYKKMGYILSENTVHLMKCLQR